MAERSISTGVSDQTWKAYVFADSNRSTIWDGSAFVELSSLADEAALLACGISLTERALDDATKTGCYDHEIPAGISEKSHLVYCLGTPAVPLAASFTASYDPDADALTLAAIKTTLEAEGSHLALMLEDTSTTLPDALAAVQTHGDSAWATATSTTCSDKTGFKLASDGLDAVVITELSAKPTGNLFLEWFSWFLSRFRCSSKTPTTLLVKTEAGATITEQTLTDDGAGTETMGAPS